MRHFSAFRGSVFRGASRGSGFPGFRPVPAARALLALALAAVLATAAARAPAQALPPLRENAHVTRSLVAAMVGEGIRRACPSIHARLLVALRKARELERYALGLGYSKEEIQAFIRDPEEKARIIALARAYMVEKGVVEGEKETYCRLGRAEIAAGTLTGQLLWSWK